jgi:hypothetical protein
MKNGAMLDQQRFGYQVTAQFGSRLKFDLFAGFEVALDFAANYDSFGFYFSLNFTGRADCYDIVGY